jgi:hypothetical protein
MAWADHIEKLLYFGPWNLRRVRLDSLPKAAGAHNEKRA